MAGDHGNPATRFLLHSLGVKTVKDTIQTTKRWENVSAPGGWGTIITDIIWALTQGVVSGRKLRRESEAKRREDADCNPLKPTNHTKGPPRRRDQINVTHKHLRSLRR
jgi:hypothetical protein